MHGYKRKQNRREDFKEWRKQSGRSGSTGEAWSNASNAPFRLHKRWVHEGGIATPLIAHWPRIITKENQNRLRQEVGHVIDILPTCLELAGAEYPDLHHGQKIKPAAGVSLLSAIKNPDQLVSRMLFWEHESHSAVRRNDWKLVTKNGEKPFGSFTT